MPDTQTMLDRGFSVAQIRQMCGSFRSLGSPKARLGFVPSKTPILDACNHAR